MNMLATCCRYSHMQDQGAKCLIKRFCLFQRKIVQRKDPQVCKPWKTLFSLCHFSLANPSESCFFSATRLFTSGRAVASLPNAMPHRVLFKFLVEVL